MKKIFTLVLLLSALFVAGTAKADTFKSGKFTFYIYENNRCAVYYFSDYSATDVEVPATATDDNGQEYTVIGIDEFGMGWGAFKTVKLPDTLEYIEAGGFSSCTSLQEITIPAKVTLIGNKAFAKCTSLTAINVAEDSETFASVDGALFNKDKDQLLLYPCGKSGAFTIPEGVTAIADLAFNTCKSLTEVSFPSTLKSIGESAFEGCTSIEEIKLPEGLETIGNSAFIDDYAIQSVTIPSTVTSIGKAAFANCSGMTNAVIGASVTTLPSTLFESCTSLESVTLPEGLTTIGDYAFQNCSSLKSVDLLKNVNSIGTRAFYQCAALTAINVVEDNASISSHDGVLYNKDQSKLLVFPAGKAGEYAIQSTCKEIDTDAFWKAINLTSVDIPASMETIGDQAFTYCSALKTVKSHAQTAPTLGEQAFSFIDGGSTLYIPEGTSDSYKDWVGYFSSVDTLNEQSSVITIAADLNNAAATEMYTINGTRVAANATLAPGIYIRRAGNQVQKVIVK